MPSIYTFSKKRLYIKIHTKGSPKYYKPKKKKKTNPRSNNNSKTNKPHVNLTRKAHHVLKISTAGRFDAGNHPTPTPENIDRLLSRSHLEQNFTHPT